MHVNKNGDVDYRPSQRAHNVEAMSIQRQDVESTSNRRSCIKSYEHSCLKLFLNGPEVVFKQQNPCSNHEMNVLFEHGF